MVSNPVVVLLSLVAGWLVLASGALASLSGVEGIANPPHIIVYETIEVVAPPLDVAHAADAAVPSVEVAPAAEEPLEATM